MKKGYLLIGLFLFFQIVVTAQDCNTDKMYQVVYNKIESDKLPGNKKIEKVLNMKVLLHDNEGNDYSFIRFTYIAGVTFRIYFYGVPVNRDSLDNAVILKLYKISKNPSLKGVSSSKKELANKNRFGLDSGESLSLLKEGTDNINDKKVSWIEYKNTEINNFILELSLKNTSPCCAVSVMCLYKNE